MTHSELLAFFQNSNQKAADALGVSKQAVSAWKDRGIPVPRQYQIEVITGGVLRVGRETEVTDA